MSTKIKFAAALTALTLATTLALPASDAQARGRGWAIAAGTVGGAIVGAAIASQPTPLRSMSTAIAAAASSASTTPTATTSAPEGLPLLRFQR